MRLLIILVLLIAHFACAGKTESDKQIDSLESVINYCEDKIDSINSMNLRKGKHWIYQSERKMPLLLPKKMKSIRPSMNLNMEINDWWIGFQFFESFKLIYADVVLSLSDRVNITVYPLPVLDVLIIDNISNKNNLYYINGFNLALSAGVSAYSVSGLFSSDFSITLWHKYLLKFKHPIFAKSWLDGHVRFQFEDEHFYYFQTLIGINREFNKYFSGKTGIIYENKQRNNWFIAYENKLQGLIGFYFWLNRHIRFHAYAAAGAGFEYHNFIGTAGGFLHFQW